MRTIHLSLFVVAALLVAACGSSGTEPSLGTPPSDTPPSPAPATTSPSAGPVTSAPAPTASQAPAPTPGPTGSRGIRFGMAGWKTDFGRNSVDLSEIRSGGPPRDGIPPVDDPKFETIEEAESWLPPFVPVIALEIEGDARAYPIAILIWHEIVNDTVGGRPVVVTFCPLCNTALVYDRRVGERLLDFGTTGNLRHSDLIMWDRQTESWWQQITGEAIVGELTGTRLDYIFAQMLPLRTFKETWPDGRVLSRDTGFSRMYGSNPYPGYDDASSIPFLYEGVADGRLAPKERVVAIQDGETAAAFPFSELRQTLFAQSTVGSIPVVVFWDAGTASPLNRESLEGYDIGSVGAFRSTIDGRQLTFQRDGGLVLDAETGSEWEVTGVASAGPLAGRQLEPVPFAEPFWFAWAAFVPETTIWTAP